MTLASTALESTAGQQQQQQQQQQEQLQQQPQQKEEQLQLSMASGSGASSTVVPAAGQRQQQLQTLLDMRELREIKQLLWGDSVREDVFTRWSQGKYAAAAPTAHL